MQNSDFADGYHAVGFSQGAQFFRGVAQENWKLNTLLLTLSLKFTLLNLTRFLLSMHTDLPFSANQKLHFNSWTTSGKYFQFQSTLNFHFLCQFYGNQLRNS